MTATLFYHSCPFDTCHCFHNIVIEVKDAGGMVEIHRVNECRDCPDKPVVTDLPYTPDPTVITRIG